MKPAKLVSLIGLLALFSSCAEDKSQINVENGLWITNVTIVPTENDTIVPYLGNLVVDRDSIVHVGAGEITVVGHFKKLDAKGKYVIPGLIDSHVHLSSIAGMSYKQVRQFPELAKSYFKQLPNSYLYFGYTTLIDPNNYNPKIMERIKNSAVSPRIYTCGEQVKVMNDFMMAEDSPEDRYTYYPNFLHDKYNTNVVLPDSININDHSVQNVVSKIVNDQEGICMKTIYEDGFGGTEEMTWELPTLDIMKDLVNEAKKENIPVLLHANSFAAQEFGVNANVDIMAHGMWHWGLLKDYLTVEQLPETHKNLLSAIALKKIGYQPTFRVIAGQKDVFNPNFVNDPNLSNVFPPNLLTWLKSEEGLWQKKRILTYGGDYFNASTPDEKIAGFMQLVLDKINVSTHHLYLKKGKLLFGSDTPAMNNHANPPGYNGFLEMGEWAKAGVSLTDLLKSATINNAKAFHLEHLYGSIETGKKANLILLNQNPLEHIEAYNTISKVVLDGKVYDRSFFSAQNQQNMN